MPLTLLGLLEREPSHGYDLKRDYDTYFGRGKQLPFGQADHALFHLEADLRWIEITSARLAELAAVVTPERAPRQ